MTSTLFRGGRIYGATDPTVTAILVAGDRIAWIGGDDAPAADTTVELDGALIAPGFVDAHVHATDTGISMAGLELSGTRSPAEVLDGVAAFAASLSADAVVLGHGWDESTWLDQRPPTAEQLDRAAGGRRVYLAQASVHSALCSSAMLAAALPSGAGVSGYAESGWLREQAHHVVRAIALGSVTTAQRQTAQLAALHRAASLGIVALHECGGPGTSSESDFTALLSVGGAANGNPEVYGYWGELMAAAKARELGAVGAGGDLYADGALGSQTAHLRDPYLDSPRSDPPPSDSLQGDSPQSDARDHRCGRGYVTAEQAGEHLVDCAHHGMQGGFHAIGDQAIATVLAGFRAAAAVVGLERIRAARHRIEHAEIVDKALIAGLVEFGIVASMQPAFDRIWGGAGQMYEQRLGLARSLASNPMGAMHGAGVPLAFGSDSPVTPLDPWGSVRAAMHHHNPVHRMTDKAAFAAHTKGGWRAVHLDAEGALRPGSPATFAAWSTPDGVVANGLPVLDASSPLPQCRRTVLRGQTIYSHDS
jgi:predicted amidohydrolase YtcJ